MASTPMGDIPGAQWPAHRSSHAAVASGGGNGRLGAWGPYPYPIRVRSANWIATGADNACTNTTSFRRFELFNGGLTGVASATGNRIASLNVTASSGSHAPVAFTTAATLTSNTVPAGAIIYASQSTVGGAETNGTVLVAGEITFSYEVL